MTITSFFAWITGAILALVSVYWIGKSNGASDEKENQTQKTLDKINTSKRIDNLDDVVVSKLPSKYD